MKKTKFFLTLIATLLIASLVLTGCSKSGSGDSVKYPSEPINMVIAFSAGGSSDVQARLMQKYWNKYVPEQPWVFKYAPGAGGAIGFAEIARSDPDGYTIGGVNVPHMVLQPLGQGAQFKVEDFEYIAQVVNDPQVIAVNKDSKFNSVQEILDYAKANPKKLKIGIVGTFTGHHLMLLELQDKTGIEPSQVVYKGSADQNSALLGGELDCMIGNVNDVVRILDQTKVLGIAAEKQHEFLPDVPTLKEQGIDIVSDIRRGFVAPKGTDPEALEFLRDAFKEISEDPEYIADMKKAGQPMEYMSGEDFEKYVFEQDEKAKNLLKKFGLIE